MESWFLILVSISISLFLKIIFNNFLTTKNLPPGPLSFPFIGHLLWLRMSAFKIEPILRSLHAKFGPMVTLRIGTRPAIFVADRTLAHEALIHGGAVFADRPPAVATRKVLTSNQHNISSSFYGPTWRLLRRNLTAEILHLSRVKSYTHARNWVLQILQNRFESQAKAGRPICVMEHFQYAMFCLLVLMCFGDKLDENQIKKIMEVQRQMIVNFSKFNILNFWPGVTKIVLRNRWRELFSHRKCQEDVLIPLIRARKKVKEERVKKSKEDKKEYEDEYVLCYVDTILALELPEEKRKFNEEEMVSLCSEFLNAGTDSTSTALQWIMANLVKHPQIQEKLLMEIKGVVQDGEENIKEEDLQKMPYLKATILEGLRRHPPGHFVLPHAVTEDAVLGKYVVPKDGTINFMVAEMGWDPEVWEDPMAFKPERFLNSGGETFDITVEVQDTDVSVVKGSMKSSKSKCAFVDLKQFSRFMKDLKVLLLDKVYVVNVIGYIIYNFVLGAYSYWGPKAGYSIYNMSNADLIFGGITIVCGIVGTLAGGYVLDLINSTISNAFKLLSAVTFAGAIFCFSAFCFKNMYPFLALFAIGELFVFATQAPVNFICLHCVKPSMRPISMAISTVAIHLFGDVPSSPLVGVLQDQTNNWRKTALILTSILFPAAVIWFIGIFLHSVDRFDEESEHPEVTTADGSNTTPLLDRKAAGTTETPAEP